MASWKRSDRALALFALALMSALAIAAAAGATVWTDKDDYTPGSTVTISGDNGNAAGYLPGETVRVDVTGPNGWTATFDAVADAGGAWSGQVTLAGGEEAVGTYTYTATGLTSGVTESGTFRDGSFYVRAVIPGGTRVGAAATVTQYGTLAQPETTCTGTPSKAMFAFTTATSGAGSNLFQYQTAAYNSNQLTAAATVEHLGVTYVFSGWSVISDYGIPVNGQVSATGCATAANPGLSMIVQANYVLPDPKIKVEKTATAEYFVAGSPVSFRYEVTNPGNVPLSSVGVTDSESGATTYQSGDANTDSKLDVGETWIFTDSYTPAFTGPNSILDNVATATGTYGATTVDDKVGLKLMGARIQKAVHLYWQAGAPDKIVPYDASGVNFTVDLYERGEGKVGTEQVAENSPLELWLTLKPSNASEAGWRFVEQAKTGYPVADDRGTIEFSVFPGTSDYLDNTLINTVDFGLSIVKTGPVFVGENGVAAFTYEVKNLGPAAVKPVVSDDKCTPKYLNGDTNNDGLIQPTEKWTFRCNDTLTWHFGWNFDTGKQLCDTNVGTVVDDEFPEDWTGTFYGGDATTPNRFTVTLCPWIIRKDVIEFGTGNQLSDTTPFTVTIKQGAKTIGTVTIKEGDPAQFWLQPGTYEFYETVLPFYLPNFESWTQNVGVDYPDWTVVNAKWYGFSHGYYKNQGARIGWGDLTPPAGYDEDAILETVFDVPDAFGFDNVELLEALSFKGGPDLAGKAEILLRQAVAAVLNESRFGASFGDFTTAELVANVNAALAGSESDMTQLAGVLALWNNGQVVTP